MIRLVSSAWRQLLALHNRLRLLRVGSVGPHVRLGEGTHLGSPRGIQLAARVELDRGCALRANTRARPGIALGEGTSLKDGVVLNANEGHVTVGEHSWLGPYCVVYGNAGVDIGSHVMVAAHTVITSVGHEHHRLDMPMSRQPLVLRPVRIADDVWIGAHCTVLPGVTIGRGAIVAAGSVGLKVRFGIMPAAIATTIVSPTAREMPRMYAAAMPEKAPGTTTLSAVCSRVAPIA